MSLSRLLQNALCLNKRNDIPARSFIIIVHLYPRSSLHSHCASSDIPLHFSKGFQHCALITSLRKREKKQENALSM